MIGDTLSRYRIVSRAGQGRTGTVYLAERTLDARRVALKIVHPEIAADPARRARLVAATRELRRLDHPRWARPIDIVEESAVLAIVTEWVEGESLADCLLRGPCAEGEAARIGAEVASAVAAVHERGLSGIDIDTTHTFLEPSGDVRLVGLEPDEPAPGRPSFSKRKADIASLGMLLRGLVRGQGEVSPAFRQIMETSLGGAVPSYGAAAEVASDLRALAPRAARSARGWLAAAATLALCLALLVATSGSAPQGKPRRPASLAVLPLAVESGSRCLLPEQFGLQIADSIITALGERGSFLVRPTGSVQRYVSRLADPIGVGRTLGVDHVLSGNVAVADGRGRLRLELRDVRTGESEWIETLSFETPGKTEANRIEQSAIQTVLRHLASTRHPA